jgi:AcrR family transcriptional regulator
MLKRPRLPTRRQPQQSRARATREHLQIAALRALQEEGEDVSMTRIAEIAGYSIGTMYQYYPDRRTLLCDLMFRVSEEDAVAVMREIPTFLEVPLREGIERIVRVLVASASRNVGLQRVVAREVLPTVPPEELEDLVPQFTAVLAAQLQRRPELVRDCDLQMASFFVLNSVESVLHRAALDQPQWLQSPDFERELVLQIHSYLAP